MTQIKAHWFGCVVLGLSLLAGCSSGKDAGVGGTGGAGSVSTGGTTGAGSGGTTGGASGGSNGAGVGGNGAAGAGAAGNSGSGGVVTGAGGAMTGVGGAGGAAGAAPLPGAACTGTSPITTAGTAASHLVVDAGQKGPAWNRFYEKVVAADHANTIVTTAYGRNIQAALKKGHDQAGFGYVRFHGILDDDVGVYAESAGQPVYTWTKLDQIYDAIIAAGMRPFVEVSFMPKALASDATKIQTLLWYNNQSPNISPPRDWTVWQTFMQNLVQHLETRYGAAEVRNNWYFEIWNESSWMYSAGNAGYNQLYQNTVQGLLKADPMLEGGWSGRIAGRLDVHGRRHHQVRQDPRQQRQARLRQLPRVRAVERDVARAGEPGSRGPERDDRLPQHDHEHREDRRVHHGGVFVTEWGRPRPTRSAMCRATTKSPPAMSPR